MPQLLYPYLIGFLTTLTVPAAAFVAYVYSYRRGVDYARRADRLPEATRWEDLSYRLKDIEGEYDELRDELVTARATIDEAQRERDWLDQNKHEIEQMRQEKAQLEEVRGNLQQALEELGTARQNREEAELATAKAKHERELEESRAKQLQEERDRLQKAAETAQQQLDQDREVLNGLQDSLRSAQQELGGAQAELEQRRQELEGLKREIAAVKEDLKAARELQKDLEELHGQIEAKHQRLSAECAGLETERDMLSKELVRRDPSRLPDEEVLVELFQPGFDVGEFEGSAKPTTETEALLNVKQYLGYHGLRFSDRTIKAFHASLKVAADAPLLVLAGISGTGKSLLPRRYAEAMGMHFLNVPVQPRWDGPQDLLGFFNYLENRFKATELTRALVQMDPIERDWLPGDYEHAAHDRMLMVLLDEMNLARVEYYFSEFLSRLEIRRDVDIESPTDRGKCELLLDAGRVGTEHRELQVFTDTNVLFVGTMNEDESTMTLSDKVIDRSNMMRFGRPRSLHPEVHANVERASSLRPEAYLLKDTWQSWCDGARTAPRDDVRTWVSELNEALSRVGRPFGYRTRNSILSYVSQYPDKGDEAVQRAVADQVEQRVLPKLRGIDTTEEDGAWAVRRIRAVVEDLGDEPLARAIDEGTKAQGGHAFTWLGVDRSEDS